MSSWAKLPSISQIHLSQDLRLFRNNGLKIWELRGFMLRITLIRIGPFRFYIKVVKCVLEII
jgi:hypothetical protein